MAMGRMGITNLAMLLQAVFLSKFPSNTSSMNSANKITLYIDILYRIILCIWFFLHTDYHQVKAKLLNTLALVRTTLDMSHASALMDQNIVQSNKKSQAITVQTSTTKVEECHLPQDNDKQEPFALSTVENTSKNFAVVKVNPQRRSSIYSVEEELSVQLFLLFSSQTIFSAVITILMASVIWNHTMLINGLSWSHSNIIVFPMTKFSSIQEYLEHLRLNQALFL